MTYYDSTLASQFRERLNSRAAELRRVLQGQVASAGFPDPHEVSDFKDVAGQETAAVVGDVQAARAAAELAQVFAAERRLVNGTFGHCMDCGAPIDLLRLTAMPATPCCTACQSIREQSATEHA